MTRGLTVAECVLPGHPDKLCDRIADRLVDLARERDPKSMVGVEVAIHRSTVFISGCVSTNPPLTLREVQDVPRQVLKATGYGGPWGPEPEQLTVHCDLRLEALGEDLRDLRAISDDQAICIGWAGGRAEHHYLPPAHRLAWLAAKSLDRERKLLGLGPDGKVLVHADAEGRARALSLSIQHGPTVDRVALYRMAGRVAKQVGLEDLEAIRVNAGGDFSEGGPMADNGLSGKKLVVEAYGPTVPIGGGAWSGKDPNKVDRLGALVARDLAFRTVRGGLAKEARVTLSWRPGDSAPHEVEIRSGDGRLLDPDLLGPIDLSISASFQRLHLRLLPLAPRAAWSSWFQAPQPWNPVLRFVGDLPSARLSDPSISASWEIDSPQAG